MGAFFTAILAKIGTLAAWFGTLAVAAFAALWFLGTDLGTWVFEQLLDVAISALNAVSFSPQLFNPATYISALPADLTNMLGILRIPESIAIIAGACVLKVTLQLIPFTRLGS